MSAELRNATFRLQIALSCLQSLDRIPQIEADNTQLQRARELAKYCDLALATWRVKLAWATSPKEHSNDENAAFLQLVPKQSPLAATAAGSQRIHSQEPRNNRP